jgi:transcriptional regulator
LSLKVVVLGPVHGYAIAQRLRRISGDVLQVQQGSLYPAPHRLGQRGWLRAEWAATETGRDARFYSLTRVGRRQLEEQRAAWDRLRESYEIVSVVRDAKSQTIREDGMLPSVCIPVVQWAAVAQPTGFYALRVTGGDPMRLVPDVERVVRDTHATLRVRSAQTYTAFIGRTILTERIMATISGLFGGLALAVAVVGVFGVLSFQVARRTNEIGVGMALGADGWTMVRLVLRDVAVMIVAGVSIGAGAALMMTGLARHLLFGLTPTDPRAFLVAASVLGAAALLAAWLPARRAARVDPLVALRHE